MSIGVNHDRATRRLQSHQHAIARRRLPAEIRNSNDWELIDSTTFQFLPAGSVKSKQISADSRRYWRMQVSSTNGATVIANMTGR